MRAIAPLPIREDWTPAYLRARHDQNRDYAFRLADAQGAPAGDGRCYHSAVDWFAPGGAAVVSPVYGLVVRVVASTDTSGQVFGGEVNIEEPNGTTWVMRHVDPFGPMYRGREVKAGEVVAKVTPWRDGGPHLHLEIWRARAGGYRHENMIDPREVEWLTASTFEVEPEWPPHGASLRLHIDTHPAIAVADYAGWDECAGPLRWIAKHGLQPGTKAAISWRGNTWRGPKAVADVAKHLVKKYL